MRNSRGALDKAEKRKQLAIVGFYYVLGFNIIKMSDELQELC
jgi:hypothetical protein